MSLFINLPSSVTLNTPFVIYRTVFSSPTRVVYLGERSNCFIRQLPPKPSPAKLSVPLPISLLMLSSTPINAAERSARSLLSNRSACWLRWFTNSLNITPARW